MQHGIRPVNSERRGVLLIAADRDGDDLLFTIRDNGLGMAEKQLADIENGVQSVLGGFGVPNAKKRIALYFGDQYGIDFKTETGRGTTVTVRIPAMLKDEILRIVDA